MSDSVNQCNAIVRYMNENGSITALEAMMQLGVGRLAARIHDLREKGYNILTTRSGTKSNYAIYIFEVEGNHVGEKQ